jgi:hypothetical protein
MRCLLVSFSLSAVDNLSAKNRILLGVVVNLPTNLKTSFMKKTILISALVLLGSVIMAQGISFGPKIGYTTNKLSSDKSDITTDLKSNLLFGAFVRLGEKVYLQPEINYYTSGSIFRSPGFTLEDGISGPVEDEITMKNIQIPLYLGVRLIDLKLANVRAMAGPTATLILDKEVKPLESVGLIKDADIGDFQWGFQFGVGADVLMFALDIQYFIGLNKLIGEVDGPDGNPIIMDSRPSGFMVSLGWKIF